MEFPCIEQENKSGKLHFPGNFKLSNSYIEQQNHRRSSMVHVLLNSCTLEHDLLKCKMVWCLFLPIHIEVTHKKGFPTLNNSRAIILVLHGIWLVIKLGQEIMPTNNITKFNNIQVTERTRFILTNLTNSRAITPKRFKRWLSNLAEVFCQQTF